jgi:hypothetical protein
MTPKEVLIAAKALIDTPEKWVQGRYQIKAAYCAWGALVESGKGEGPVHRSCQVLANAVPKRSRKEGYLPTVWSFNDARGRTHKQVMRWFDRAIEAAS